MLGFHGAQMAEDEFSLVRNDSAAGKNIYGTKKSSILKPSK